MRLFTLVAVALMAATLALPAGSAPPAKGVFVPGQSLAGVTLGMTQNEVLAEWGPNHGVCLECTAETWYFNSVPFAPEGAGAIFDEGVAVQLFTLWKPEGWTTPDGLTLGDPEDEVPGDLVVSEERTCDGYLAILSPDENAVSVFYVYAGSLWGFGLMRPELNPCL